MTPFSLIFPAGICMFKVSNRNTRTRCEICSKLTIKTPERLQWRHSDVFIVNFEHISDLALVFLLLTLSKLTEGKTLSVFLVSLLLTLNIFHTLF